MFKVKKQTLLAIACIVWGIAGFNVLRIGILSYPGYVNWVNILLSVVVYVVFQKFIFGKLVKKHTKRIKGYEEEKQFFLKFFDVKSFIIMAVMISGGIIIRAFELAPVRFIAFFYTGLGASLFTAGVLFGVNYFRKDEKVTMSTIKKYMNFSIFYGIMGLVGGVFYREFTKFNGFTGDTMLSVVHTHYLILGMMFFLVLVLFEKNFNFSDKKTSRILIFYHVGLNMTIAMFVVRGILQVLGTELSKGLNASISGVAGIGHIILGVCLVMVVFEFKKMVESRETKDSFLV